MGDNGLNPRIFSDIGHMFKKYSGLIFIPI